MIRRLVLFFALSWGLFVSGIMSCGGGGPGGGEFTGTEESGSEAVSPPATGTTTGEGATGGTTGETATGGTGTGGTTTGGSTTGGTTGGTTAGTTGGTTGGTATGGSTGGATTGGFTLENICLTHPEVCSGIEVAPATAIGPAPVGPGSGPAGWAEGDGGLSPYARFRDRTLPGSVSQFGTVIRDQIVFRDFAQGGTFTATGETVTYNAATKTFPAGTVFTVKDGGDILATFPNGTTDTVSHHAVFVFKEGASATATGGATTALERGSAIQLREGGFDMLQIGATTFKGMPTPNLQQNLNR